MRIFPVIAPALLFSTAAWTAAPPPPPPIGPAAIPFKLGALQLATLRDNIFPVPNDGKTFGVGVPTDQVAAVLKQAGRDGKVIPLDIDVLLVRLPGHVVLIDTGYGPKINGLLLRSLENDGLTPGEVTDILITHSHPDHVGGLLTENGKLAFPKATIRMSAPEWAFMQAKADKALVEAIRSKVQTFQPGAALLPGIRAVAIPGHTPGHSGYEISSGKEKLLDIGDTAHSSIVSLAKPGWTIQYDTDAKAGRAAREATLARLAASHERIFSPHFPFPGVGFVVKAGEGYRWQPAVPGEK